MFMFREELGHDVLGAPPPSVSEAADRIASLRTALDACLPAADPAVMDKTVEVPPFGSLPMAQLLPLIIGHLEEFVERLPRQSDPELKHVALGHGAEVGSPGVIVAGCIDLGDTDL